MPADTFHSKMFSVLLNKDREDEHRLGVGLGKETRRGKPGGRACPPPSTSAGRDSGLDANSRRTWFWGGLGARDVGSKNSSLRHGRRVWASRSFLPNKISLTKTNFQFLNLPNKPTKLKVVSGQGPGVPVFLSHPVCLGCLGCRRVGRSRTMAPRASMKRRVLPTV